MSDALLVWHKWGVSGGGGGVEPGDLSASPLARIDRIDGNLEELPRATKKNWVAYRKRKQLL